MEKSTEICQEDGKLYENKDKDAIVTVIKNRLSTRQEEKTM